MVPVKQKCLACRWDIYCSTNNLLWWSKPSQGAESDAAAIHLLPCFPFQGHGDWSGRVAYLTSSPKNGDAWLPDSEPQGRTSSHCKKTDAVPLKNKNMHNRLMSWGSQAWGRCLARARRSIALICHRRNVRARGRPKPFLMLAQAYLSLGDIDPDVSRIRYLLGVKYMFTWTAGSAPAPCMAERRVLPPGWYSKKNEGHMNLWASTETFAVAQYLRIIAYKLSSEYVLVGEEIKKWHV